jgi:hypothetical protein
MQRASVTNAKKAFSNFSIGKTAEQKKTRKYVAPGQNVAERQRAVITRQLEDMKPVGNGLTIIASPDALKLEGGKMELSVILTAMEKAKNGFVFYTGGTTLTDQINIQNQAADIIAAIKKGGPNNG